MGRHWPAIADIDGLNPYVSPEDTAHAGCRDDDEELQEATALLGAVLPASQIQRRGAEQAARKILDVADRADLDGYWIHLDVDILDPSVMPAVDSPRPRRSERRRVDRTACRPRSVCGRRTGDRLRPRPRPGRQSCPPPHRHPCHRPRPAQPRPLVSPVCRAGRRPAGHGRRAASPSAGRQVITLLAAAAATIGLIDPGARGRTIRVRAYRLAGRRG